MRIWDLQLPINYENHLNAKSWTTALACAVSINHEPWQPCDVLLLSYYIFDHLWSSWSLHQCSTFHAVCYTWSRVVHFSCRQSVFQPISCDLRASTAERLGGSILEADHWFPSLEKCARARPKDSQNTPRTFLELRWTKLALNFIGPYRTLTNTNGRLRHLRALSNARSKAEDSSNFSEELFQLYWLAEPIQGSERIDCFRLGHESKWAC